MTDVEECGTCPYTMDERVKTLLSTGREHYQKREFAKAEPLLMEVVEHDGGRYADVYNMLGVIAHERSDFENAERFFERSTKINPNYTEALLNLAVTYNDRSKYEAANEIYRSIRNAQKNQADGIDPFVKGKIANMHAQLAQAYEDASLNEQAVHELEKAVALCPTFADLRTRLGSLYRNTGDLARAREQYELARDANPRYTQAGLLLGITLLSQNEVDNAVECWRDVLKHDPDNRTAKMYLRMAESSPRSSNLPNKPTI